MPNIQHAKLTVSQTFMLFKIYNCNKFIIVPIYNCVKFTIVILTIMQSLQLFITLICTKFKIVPNLVRICGLQNWVTQIYCGQCFYSKITIDVNVKILNYCIITLGGFHDICEILTVKRFGNLQRNLTVECLELNFME